MAEERLQFISTLHSSSGEVVQSAGHTHSIPATSSAGGGSDDLENASSRQDGKEVGVGSLPFSNSACDTQQIVSSDGKRGTPSRPNSAGNMQEQSTKSVSKRDSLVTAFTGETSRCLLLGSPPKDEEEKEGEWSEEKACERFLGLSGGGAWRKSKGAMERRESTWERPIGV